MKTKFKSQRKGAVLMTVVVVSMMMVVIVASATSLVHHTNARTNKEYRKKQAYFAASSCLEAFVAETTGFSLNAGNTAEQVAEAIDKLQRIADDGSTVPVEITKIDAMGDPNGDLVDDNPRWNEHDMQVTLRLEKIGGSNSALKAISTATYLGVEKTVVAYLSIKPLSQSAYVPNALEIIGTDGGKNESYNNINVYGNTAAPLKESDTVNTVYQFTANNNTFFGDMSILGSGVCGVAMTLKQNPYYIAGTTNEMTPGCTLQVSKTFHIANNNPKIKSNMIKTNNPEYNVAPTGINAYNYINVYEAFIMSGVSATQIGEPGSAGSIYDADAKMVDIYTSLLVLGKMNSVSGLTSWCANGSDGFDAGVYETAIMANSDAQGQEAQIYGNVYTYSKDGNFDGSIYITGINNHFYGDVYSSGNIYIDDGLTLGQVDFKGKIYLAPGKKIMKGSNRDTATVMNIDSAPWKDNVVYDSNWINENPRATRPSSPYDNVIPYYYYPEHLMCQPGKGDVQVSTISQTYASMYDNVDDNGTDDVISADAPKISEMRNTSGRSFTASNGVTVTPDYIITKSCVVDKRLEGTYMIDLDSAEDNLDGGKDIVIIMKDTSSEGFNGQFCGDALTRVFVNNTNDPEGPDARFVYFVSDSGVGTTDDEYGISRTESTYNTDTFKRVNINCGNGKLMLMDFETYARTGYSGGSGAGINPTKRDLPEPTYNLPAGSIIMMLTEGCKFAAGQQSVMQATIFIPRGEFKWTNDAYSEGGGYAYIEPSHSVWSPTEAADGKGNREIKVNILGSLICNRFEASANDNTIVYQQVSKNSMVAITHGVGESAADESFQLVKYANA